MSGSDPGATVSVALAARNEELRLGAALTSLLAQDSDRLVQIVVAVAPSTDRTAEIAHSFAASEPRLEVIENPSGNTPDGFNLAAAQCRGDYLALMNAHCTIDTNYVSLGLATARQTGAANVGGRQHAVGDTEWTRDVAAAMNSRLGAGLARHHWDDQPGPIESVPLGFFRKDIFDAMGGFDSTLERNQDYELNWRLRQGGHVVWFNPDMVVDYHPRPTLRALARQYWDYGCHKQRVLRMWPRSLRPHHAAPPLLVLGLGASSVLAALFRPWLWIVPASYVAGVGFAARRLRRDDGQRAGLRATAAVIAMHVSWGAGLLVGARQNEGDHD